MTLHQKKITSFLFTFTYITVCDVLGYTVGVFCLGRGGGGDFWFVINVCKNKSFTFTIYFQKIVVIFKTSKIELFKRAKSCNYYLYVRALLDFLVALSSQTKHPQSHLISSRGHTEQPWSHLKPGTYGVALVPSQAGDIRSSPGTISSRGHTEQPWSHLKPGTY